MKKIFALLLIVFVGVLSGISYIYLSSPVDMLKTQYPNPLKKRDEKIELKWSGNKPDSWVQLSKLDRYIYMAIVIPEDWSFFDHDGLDLNQLKIVLKESFKQGELTRGASTISQQLVKNLFLTEERSLWRKFVEAVYTIKLEREYTKEKILETYLNIIEWGPNIFGIQNASQYYFNKDAQFLTLREAAFLAMLIPSPKRYAQSFYNQELTEFATSTIAEILTKLRQAKVITEEQREIALSSKFLWEKSNFSDDFESYGTDGIGEIEGSDFSTEVR